MKITEIITEERAGELHDRFANASKGVWKMRDNGGFDRVYHLNRIMMATAMHDGQSDKPVDMDPASWIEKYNTAHPYTDEENNMIKGALATVGADSKHLVSDSNSKEEDHVNRASPHRSVGAITLNKKKK
jgi:hypothetical protein